MHLKTKLDILVDFLEANSPWDRKMTLNKPTN